MDAALVQIVENHAEIAGELVSMTPDRSRAGFVTLMVTVRGTSAVEGWPNFFDCDVGQTIAIAAREGSAASAARPGEPVRLRVRKAGPALSFAED